jgi:hypothetical protein
MTGAAIGAILGMAFGGIWAIAGAMGLAPGWRLPVAVLAAAATVALIAAPGFAHLHPTASGTFRGTIYGLWVGFEVVAIAAAAVVLNRCGRQDLLMPVIGIIVGVHFVGLWQATGLLRFVTIAVGVTAVCALSLLLPGHDADGMSARQVVAGVGTGLVLWLAGVWTFLDG